MAIFFIVGVWQDSVHFEGDFIGAGDIQKLFAKEDSPNSGGRMAGKQRDQKEIQVSDTQLFLWLSLGPALLLGEKGVVFSARRWQQSAGDRAVCPSACPGLRKLAWCLQVRWWMLFHHLYRRIYFLH